MLSLGGVVCSAVFAFVFSVVVARGLGAAGAGIFFASIGLLTIAISMAQFGASTGLVRMLARLRALDRTEDLRAMVAVAIVPGLTASLAVAALVFAFAPQLADLLLDGRAVDAATSYLQALAPFLPLMVAFDVVIAATRGLGAMVPWVAIHNVGVSIARPALGVLVLLAGLGPAVFAVAWAAPVAVGLVAALWALRSLVRRAERAGGAAGAEPATGRGTLAGEFWRFATPLGVALVLQIVLLWLDTILLAALASPEEAGVYKTVGSVILQGTFAQNAIILVIGPLLSGLLARSEHERAQTLYQTATWWITAISWPLYLSLIVFAPLVLETMFGAEFAAGGEPLRILALAMLVGMAAGPVNAGLVMSGRSGWNLANMVAAVIVNVVLNLLLIPPLGMTGAAIAWAASILVTNIAPGIQLWRFTGLRSLGSGFWIVAAATGACFGALGLVITQLTESTIATFVGFAVLATSLYAGLMWRLRRQLAIDVLMASVAQRRTGKALRR